MAFIDTRTLATGHRIESDICVIGSGAAGLAIASHFLDRTTRVTLLESGGMTFDPQVQSLYRGRVVAQAHANLDECRLRYFGGSTNHWTAHVRPLEPIDFESRPWVPHSGWPFGLTELAPYYAKAKTLLRLPERAFDVEALQRPGREPLRFDGDRVATVVRRIVPAQHRALGPIFRDDIAGSRNVDTFLFANVLRIELDESRRRIVEIHAGTLDGVRVTATARYYVLAAGGIENPRILLLSSVGSHCEAAESLVGGFYANHPAGWGGYLQPSGPRFDASFYQRFADSAGAVGPFLVLSEEIQRRSRLLNCWIQPSPRMGPAATRKAQRREDISPGHTATRNLRPVVRDVDVAKLALDMDRDHAAEGDDRPRAEQPLPGIGLRIFGEPSPNPASRVRLDDELDAFGQRRVALDWRLDPRDSESVRETLRVFARAVGASGLGRVRITFPEQGFESIRTVGNHHHMGTTRMHRDPKRGVVDENCRFHGISNLFVAGSSVFPTYGTANPTLTLLALAYRLAEHLQGKV